MPKRTGIRDGPTKIHDHVLLPEPTKIHDHVLLLESTKIRDRHTGVCVEVPEPIKIHDHVLMPQPGVCGGVPCHFWMHVEQLWGRVHTLCTSVWGVACTKGRYRSFVFCHEKVPTFSLSELGPLYIHKIMQGYGSFSVRFI